MFPPDWQGRVLAAHGDLYGRHADGYPALRITDGRIELGSVNRAAFGLQPFLDPARFEPRTCA